MSTIEMKKAVEGIRTGNEVENILSLEYGLFLEDLMEAIVENKNAFVVSYYLAEYEEYGEFDEIVERYYTEFLIEYELKEEVDKDLSKKYIDSQEFTEEEIRYIYNLEVEVKDIWEN